MTVTLTTKDELAKDMRISQPLFATNPEFLILDFPGYREYRVENWRVTRDGTGRVIYGTTAWTWPCTLVLFIAFVFWPKVTRPVQQLEGHLVTRYFQIHTSTWVFEGFALLGILSIWVKCTQVLSGTRHRRHIARRTEALPESVIVLPPHGIQLETHRGLPSLRLSATRRFIPLSVLQDLVINEGLRRWDVRYYLAAIKKLEFDEFGLQVAYEVG